jgi:hypothetical protein
MKEQDPFNPAMPAEFKLLGDTGATAPGQQAAGANTDSVTGSEKTKCKSRRSRKQAAGSRTRTKCKVRWEQMKQKLNAKLGGLDKEKLKTVLVACGIAGGVVLSVIVAVKLVPIAVLLLALLGLAAVIKIWDRLRRLPPPV